MKKVLIITGHFLHDQTNVDVLKEVNTNALSNVTKSFDLVF